MLGGVGGALVGGLLGWGIASLFGLGNKAVKYDKPIPTIVTNTGEFMKMYTLPSSRYFNPTGRSFAPSQFNQTNQFNITGGPKTAQRVQQGLSDFALLQQFNRGRW